MQTPRCAYSGGRYIPLATNRGMLERAKACLRSGVREPLRCANGISPRTARLLHSTFWSHGAGDLDLSPWAVPMSAVPHDLLLRHDRPTPSSKVFETSTVDSAPEKGVFLEFLYPSQALSASSRMSGQYWEKCERRNTRRPPGAFMHGLRGNALRNYAHNASTGPDESPGNAEESRAESHAIDSVEERGKEEMDEEEGVWSQLDAESGTLVDSHYESNTFLTDSGPRQGSGEDDLSFPGFADFPAGLSQAGDSDHALHKLRVTIHKTLANPAQNSPDSNEILFGDVWKQYESLDEQSKNDPTLRIQLLIWLSYFDMEQALSRCAELYHSLPVQERSEKVYLAALSVFLARNEDVEAFKLHEEALEQVSKPERITQPFFAFAVRRRKWQLAVQIEAQYRMLASKKHGSERARNLWSTVPQLPRSAPRSRALELAKWVRAAGWARSNREQVQRFCVDFLKEALIQEMQIRSPVLSERTYRAGRIPPASLRTFHHFIRICGEWDPRFFEDIILTMVRPNALYHYADVHVLVTYAYQELRKTGRIISEHILGAFLDRLTRHSEKLHVHKRMTSVIIRNVASDWKRMHTTMSAVGLEKLLAHHAREGHVLRFSYWMNYLKSAYPTFAQQNDFLWTTIYLHARRADLPEATKAFEAIMHFAQENGQVPSLRCWNVLLHAQYRADDLEDALSTLQRLIQTGLTPTAHSFHPVVGMLAKRGEVGGVRDVLAQYDRLTEQKRETAFVSSLLLAHVNSDEMEEAERILHTAIGQAKEGKLNGSMTGPFNIVLTAHALRKNIDDTMRVYHQMEDEGVPADEGTYGALMAVLTLYRRTALAYDILTKTMRDANVDPTAHHYALVINGFTRQREFDKALEVYERMKSRRVRQTASSSAAYLKAKGLQVDRQFPQSLSRGMEPESPSSGIEPQSLDDVIKDMRNFLHAARGTDVVPKQPQIALENPIVAQDRYFDFLIHLHGRRRSFEAARELFRQSRVAAGGSKDKTTQPSLGLLASFMSALVRAGDYKEVEQCWSLAKELADKAALPVPVPQFQPFTPGSVAHKDGLREPQSPPSDIAEGVASRDQSQTDGESVGEALPPKQRQTLLTEGTSVSTVPKPVPGRNHLLTRPLRIYMIALANQSRVPDMLRIVSQLHSQGYIMNNQTWNSFIRLLCNAQPPLVLLAYTLTERFLIPHFPGWANPNNSPTVAARAEGLQYIRARYLRPGQLMPQYETCVRLGAALLQLRQVEYSGRRGAVDKGSMNPALGKYVGTPSQVRKHAPRTLFAVQSMPVVEDYLQRTLLRREWPT